MALSRPLKAHFNPWHSNYSTFWLSHGPSYQFLSTMKKRGFQWNPCFRLFWRPFSYRSQNSLYLWLAQWVRDYQEQFIPPGIVGFWCLSKCKDTHACFDQVFVYLWIDLVSFLSCLNDLVKHAELYLSVLAATLSNPPVQPPYWFPEPWIKMIFDAIVWAAGEFLGNKWPFISDLFVEV